MVCLTPRFHRARASPIGEHNSAVARRPKPLKSRRRHSSLTCLIHTVQMPTALSACGHGQQVVFSYGQLNNLGKQGLSGQRDFGDLGAIIRDDVVAEKLTVSRIPSTAAGGAGCGATSRVHSVRGRKRGRGSKGQNCKWRRRFAPGSAAELAG